MAKRVVLAYSGGLDTSVAVRWMIDNLGVEVIALAVDVGQAAEDYEVVQGAGARPPAPSRRSSSTPRRSSPPSTARRRSRPTRSTRAATRWCPRCPAR